MPFGILFRKQASLKLNLLKQSEKKKFKSLQTTQFLTTGPQERASSSFADGLAYSTLVGHMDDKRVVFEASLGGAKEDHSHTQNDALKILRILALSLSSKHMIEERSLHNIRRVYGCQRTGD